MSTRRRTDNSCPETLRLHLVADASAAEQRAAVLVATRQHERGRVDAAGLHELLAMLGLLDTAHRMRPPAGLRITPDGLPLPTKTGPDALAAAVRARRAALGLSRRDLFRRGGPTAATVRNTEAGRTIPGPATRDLLDHALGWPPGTTDRILGGDTT